MVIPFLIPIAAGVGSSLLTGLTSYFVFRSHPGPHIAETKGEMSNNVHLAIQENNNQNNTLTLLVLILVCIKLLEVTIFTVNSLKKSFKKKYASKYAQTPAVQPQAPIRPPV